MKMLRKALGLVLLFLVVMLTTGFIYQKVCVEKELRDCKPPGQRYLVGGRNMHVYVAGSGHTTVVFAAGWGTANPYADFATLYAKVSKRAKVVVYDRFGYGYSDTTSERRDIDRIVDEIHELLVRSGQTPPYVFVGHSLASLETIRYAQRYGSEVNGIVLIDGGNPEYYAKQEPLTIIAELQQQLIRFGIARFLYQFRWGREFIDSERNGLRLLPTRLKELDRICTLVKGCNDTVVDEMRRSKTNAQLVAEGSRLGDIPLTVITAGDFGKASASWLNSQVALKDWTTKGKQFTVEDTAHYIHQYKPEVIVREIDALID